MSFSENYFLKKQSWLCWFAEIYQEGWISVVSVNVWREPKVNNPEQLKEDGVWLWNVFWCWFVLFLHRINCRKPWEFLFYVTNSDRQVICCATFSSCNSPPPRPHHICWGLQEGWAPGPQKVGGVHACSRVCVHGGACSLRTAWQVPL